MEDSAGAKRPVARRLIISPSNQRISYAKTRSTRWTRLRRLQVLSKERQSVRAEIGLRQQLLRSEQERGQHFLVEHFFVEHVPLYRFGGQHRANQQHLKLQFKPNAEDYLT